MELSSQVLLNIAVAPGIVLLVLSSAFRYQTLENQVARVMTTETNYKLTQVESLRKRAKRFRAVFVTLYIALAFTFTAATIPLIFEEISTTLPFSPKPLVLSALFAVLYALSQLLLEARHSTSTLVQQLDNIKIAGELPLTLQEWAEKEEIQKH